VFSEIYQEKTSCDTAIMGFISHVKGKDLRWYENACHCPKSPLTPFFQHWLPQQTHPLNDQRWLTVRSRSTDVEQSIEYQPAVAVGTIFPSISHLLSGMGRAWTKRIYGDKEGGSERDHAPCNNSTHWTLVINIGNRQNSKNC